MNAVSKPLNFSITLSLLLCVFSASAASPYGINARSPVAPYLNMPQTPPVPVGDFITVSAFPNLTFQNLTYVTGAPNSGLLFACEREGRIYSFLNQSSSTDKTLVLDISAHCQGWSDSGLLGLAFHPEFGVPGSQNRGYFYVWYNYSSSPVPGPGYLQSGIPSWDRLSRFTIPDGSLVADPTSELVLIDQFDQSLWHDGGSMFFGTDGFLYVSLGDQGGYNDEFGTTQSITGSLFSGVIRIDVDKKGGTTSHAPLREPANGKTTSNGVNYFIPNSNPWVGVPNALEEFYCIGFRSPHRMSLDKTTQQIWLGDVGQDTREEVNIVLPGRNYQWSYMEGTVAGPKPKPATIIGIEQPPLYDYPHANGDNCVIGGYVYRGQEHAASLSGKYIFGDNGSGRIWTLDSSTTPPTVALLCNMPPGSFATGLSSFGIDQNNEIYMCQMGSNGQIYKLARSGASGSPIPTLLSQTGVFSNTPNMTPNTGIIPYGVNTPLWSDGALKNRWIALPNDGAPYTAAETIGFAPTGEWQFPGGTVFVKHFDLVVDETTGAKRRLETRLLIRNAAGVYGVTYKWRSDNSEADLLADGQTEAITIKTANGTRQQTWYYPSRNDCLICHNSNANFVLGVKTRQQNGNYSYSDIGVTDNQLRAWNHIGMFSTDIGESNIPNFSRLSAVTDTTASLQSRVRSYIDANCAQCHRPNGVQGYFDARFDTAIDQQGLISGPVVNTLGIDNAKVIKPQDIWRSVMYVRANSVDYSIKMPWLAKNIVDTQAMSVMSDWINSLSGTPALAPPNISPGANLYSSPIQVSMSAASGASIYFTVDGTTPTTASTLYTASFTVSSTTTVKAIAVAAGFDQSVVATANYSFTNLRAPENPTNIVNGVDYKYYEGNWDILPDFNTMIPIETGSRANFDIDPRKSLNYFGFKFTGYVNIPVNGIYTFFTSSDDGSQLYIGNTLVVDNDGLHPMLEKSGTIGLQAGKHAITVLMFDQGWSNGLQVSYAGPVTAKQLIPDSELYRISDPLRDPDNPLNPVNGVTYDYYEGNWDVLPDFSTLTPIESGVRSNFSIIPSVSNNYFGFVFNGFVNVPTDGYYTFFTSSDDGSKLYIGNTAIVNNDGLHPMQEQSGTIGLKAGMHSITVEFFDQYWDEGLVVSYSGPGITKQTIPDSALFYSPPQQSATITLSNLTQVYNGTPKSATVTTNPAGLTTQVTYNGSTNAPIEPGSYDILAVVTQAGYQGSATGTLTITQGTATVTLSGLSQTYSGTPKSVTATTNPPGLAVTITYNGSSTAPTNAGSYAVAAVVNDVHYQGSATGTFVITKANASVTLGNLSQTYDGKPKTVSVTTNPAGLNVTVVYKGLTSPPTNAGSYSVTATVNDANYQGSATGTLVIDKATAQVTLSNLTQVYDGKAKDVTVTTVPASLAYKVTYNGSAKSPSKIGSYAVVVTITDKNYQGSATGTLNIVKSLTATTSLSMQTAPASLPNAPSGLTAVTVSSQAIDLSWLDNSSDEDGFSIERSLDGITWSEITIVAANSTAYHDIGLLAATSYAYRIRSYNSAGSSDYSNVSSSATFSGSLVTIESVSTGKTYKLSTAQIGVACYIDQTTTIAALSSGLNGATMIQTANSDASVTADSHLVLALDSTATLYVCYDRRATQLPAWLSTWTKSSESFSTTDGKASPMLVYSKTFAQGQLILGGNLQAPAAGVKSNYIVIVKASQ